MIEGIVKKHKVDTIYNLAALLSVVAERKPLLAWHIGIDGLMNVLEVARQHGCAVFTPSSIGSFGPETPSVKTPQDTVQRPRTIYGVSKVTTELLSDYYFHKFGVDTRAVRFPRPHLERHPSGRRYDGLRRGYLLRSRTGREVRLPDTGRNVYGYDVHARRFERCNPAYGSRPARLVHRNAFNIASMSFAPEEIYAAIKKYKPDFEMVYDVDPLKQAIASSWPDSLDDTCARQEWDWAPHYDPRLDDARHAREAGSPSEVTRRKSGKVRRRHTEEHSSNCPIRQEFFRMLTFL